MNAASLMITAVLFGMPLFMIPAILGGARLAEGLVRATWIGLGVFAVLAGPPG
jgi:hypothetical protein